MPVSNSGNEKLIRLFGPPFKISLMRDVEASIVQRIPNSESEKKSVVLES